jgi:hypothetical protein
MSYAPIIIAVVPVLLKLVTVNTSTPPAEPQAMARSAGEVIEVAPRSKVDQILFG